MNTLKYALAAVIATLASTAFAPLPVAHANGGGPTNADGAELVEEVRDREILQNMYDSMIVQTLAAICDSARNLAPYGVTDDDLAGYVLAGYGLSKKDAKWLIKTSLQKCHWT